MASNPNNPNSLKHPQTTYRLNASQVASSPSLIVPSSQQPVACWLAKPFGNAAISEASSLAAAKNGRNLTNRRDNMGWTMINPWIFFGSMMINDPCRSHPELKSQRYPKIPKIWNHASTSHNALIHTGWVAAVGHRRVPQPALLVERGEPWKTGLQERWCNGSLTVNTEAKEEDLLHSSPIGSLVFCWYVWWIECPEKHCDLGLSS